MITDPTMTDAVEEVLLPYHILFYGDLQVGHRTAIWPPYFTTWEKGEYHANRLQRYLWDCWMDSIENELPPRIDVAVNLGETVEGRQKKEDAVPLITADMGIQADAAIEVLDPLLARADKKYFMTATHYHEGPSHVAVKPVAQAFDAVENDWGTRLWDELLIEKYGVRMQIQHTCPVFKVYKATMVEREMIYSRLSEAVQVYGNVQGVIRGHVHNYVKVETLVGSELHWGFTAPGWQMQTEYVSRWSRFRTLSQIGMVLVTIMPPKNIYTPLPQVITKAWGYEYPKKGVIQL